MPTSTLRIALCTTIVLAVAACGDDKGEEFTPAPPFEDKGHVAAWANSASAVGIYFHVYQTMSAVDGNTSAFPDPECPVIEDDGTTWTATGDCVATNPDDDSTQEWAGTATVVRNGGDRSATFEDFDGKTGTFEAREVEAGRWELDVDLDVGGVTFIQYMGSVQGGYDQATLWNGSGSVKRDGFIAPNGEVEASTIDQVWDSDVCAGQAVSGRTILKSGEDTAVVTYDGETDCDEDDSAQLTVNDEDQGLVAGVTCSVRGRPGGKSGGPGAFGALLLGLASLAARAGRLCRRSALGGRHSSRRRRP
jgi:hypothetical protein